MRNRSLRSKIIVLTSAAILLSTIVILLVAVIGVHTVSERSAERIMVLLGEENAAKTTNTISQVEHSVETIAIYAQNESFGFGSDLNRLFVDSDYRSTYMKRVKELASSEGGNSPSATTVFCQLTTEITGSNTGFMMIKDDGEFEDGVLTVISDYESSDVEHVGWYYLPKEQKEPVWIGPYKNRTYGMQVVTYVVPMYYENIFIGVVGMDVNVEALSAELFEVETYAGGTTMLFGPNGDLIYHSMYQDGIEADKFSETQQRLYNTVVEATETQSVVEYAGESGTEELYASNLGNNMLVAVSVPRAEIYRTQQRVILIGAIISIVLLVLSILLTTYFINGFLKPLNELIAASERLADGQVDVTIEYKEDDEIGRLGQTFELMANSIKKYFDHFHSLAYTDSLTGLNNKAAYTITRDVIESEVQMGRASFAIIVMDVNNLKTINDTLGHEKGDILLTHVAECLRKTFVGFPLYRIGGDEFCTIINDTDPQVLIALLQAVTAQRSAEDFESFQCRYQIAAGAATYEKERDISFDDVFQRADDAMYENKKLLKEKEKQNKIGVGATNMPDVTEA